MSMKKKIIGIEEMYKNSQISKTIIQRYKKAIVLGDSVVESILDYHLLSKHQVVARRNKSIDQIFGDLLLTATSPKSRNYSFGYLIGSKVSKDELDNYIKNTTIEGLYTLKSISELVKNKDVDMPIINLMEQIIYENKNPEELINFLIQKP